MMMLARRPLSQQTPQMRQRSKPKQRLCIKMPMKFALTLHSQWKLKMVGVSPSHGTGQMILR